MDILGIIIVAQAKELSLSFNLCDKVIAYIKNKRANLSNFTWAFSSMRTCAPLAIGTPWLVFALTMLLTRLANMLAMMQVMCSPFKG
jgi:hypothetical protein